MRKNSSYITFRCGEYITLSGRKLYLPIGVKAKCRDGVIRLSSGEPICLPHSEIGREYFGWNGDGNGILRGRLTYAIAKAPRHHGEQFRLREYEQEELLKRWPQYVERSSAFLFLDPFYVAPIDHLANIASYLRIDSLSD